MSIVVPAAMAAWPDKPIKVLVPTPAGGAFDLVARILAQQLSTDLGKPVVVENKPGGAGNIAVNALLAAPPDGQTILINTTNVITEIPHVMQVSFDPLKDLKPVAAVAKSVTVLIGSPNLPARDFPGLVKYIKAHPGTMSYASYSAGTISHYAGEIMNQKAGLDLQHVPFAGSPQALPQIIGGQIPLMYNGIVNSLPMIRTGKVRAYAVAAKQRSPQLPQVPTFAELGYPDMDFGNWGGVFVSAKMSGELTQRIHDAVYKAASDPNVQAKIRDLGFDTMPPQTVQELGQAIRTEYYRNADIVKTYHIHQ